MKAIYVQRAENGGMVLTPKGKVYIAWQGFKNMNLPLGTLVFLYKNKVVETCSSQAPKDFKWKGEDYATVLEKCSPKEAEIILRKQLQEFYSELSDCHTAFSAIRLTVSGIRTHDTGLKEGELEEACYGIEKMIDLALNDLQDKANQIWTLAYTPPTLK